MPSLDGLQALTSLTIGGFFAGNNQLQALLSLEKNTKLNSVRIGWTAKIEGLPELGDVDRLEFVFFDGGDIEAVKGLPATVTIGTNYDVSAFSKHLNQARKELGLDPAKVVSW